MSCGCNHSWTATSFNCHGGEDAEAEIYLSAFETFAATRREADVWLKVDEMLDSSQMPPMKALNRPMRNEIRWVRQYLTAGRRLREPVPSSAWLCGGSTTRSVSIPFVI
ncbi:MAG: hypothetical protein M2R45_00457 [Verrucomicrobia subdivision 3 bacterium]|nr:hypothetical protein [Limisphaerales bacterium]MCS1413663.1 hypothetical protein [Limisphaerales bacterium]